MLFRYFAVLRVTARHSEMNYFRATRERDEWRT